MSILFVCLMGVGIVFIGLICIIILSYPMSTVIRAIEGKNSANAPVSAPSPSGPAPASEELSPEKRREIIAAVSAVIAEELGKDVGAIRVTSFKKI